ncbi:MAG: DUF1624 domain-containing protein, partial [Flavisolibacter sp.]
LPPFELTRTYATQRVESIDLLRGLVMIIMALDHTRDFFHAPAWTQDPLDLNTTSPILFFTRWITHFCAPVFVFLAGTSIFFQDIRKTKKELSVFLLKRGLWLILMEILVINFAFSFDITPNFIALQVIWTIGISMVIMGLMIWLPLPVILLTGLLIVFLHNSLDPYEANLNEQSPGLFYDLIHRQSFHQINDFTLLILYPFLPWTGLMMLGYCFGKLYTTYLEEERKKILIFLGIALILFFIGLRISNAYGDNQLWSTQKNFLYSLFSFINTDKYPPSLLYLCMTIGPAILFLAFVKGRNELSNFITVFGRVPFFYYVLHFYLLHFVSSICFLARGHTLAEGFTLYPGSLIRFNIPGEGYPLWVAYVAWISAILVLYPLCKWYSEYKRTHRHWWLSYL